MKADVTMTEAELDAVVGGWQALGAAAAASKLHQGRSSRTRRAATPALALGGNSFSGVPASAGCAGGACPI